MFFGKKKQNEELIEAFTQHTRMCDARASELADMCRKWREERMGEDLKKAEEEPKHDVLDPVELNVISKDTFEEAAKQVFDSYSETLAKSFGPYGAPTLIYRHPFSHVTKDGYTIATSLSTNVAKTYTNQAIANMMTEICGRMNTAVGDGTTTAIVATNNIYRSYLQKKNWFEGKGVMSRNILATFEAQKKAIHEQLSKHATPIHVDLPVTDEDDMVQYIRDVVNISDNGDDTITNTLADLYKKFGMPCITCDKSVDGIEKVEVVEGYRAPFFITDKMYINSDDKTMQLDEADVLVFTCKVTENIYESIIMPTLQISEAMGRHLLMVCPSVDEVLLDRVIAPRLTAEYKQRHDNSLVICCYKAANSYQRKSIEDFAMLCHTQPISRATATAMIQATTPKVPMPGTTETGAPAEYNMYELLGFYRTWCPTNYVQLGLNGERMSLKVLPHSQNLDAERSMIIKSKEVGIIVPGLPVREKDGEVSVVDEPTILEIGYCKDLELGEKTSIIRTFFYDQAMYDLHLREAEDNLREVENKYKKLGTFNLEITKAQERLFSLGLQLAHIEVGGDSELAIGMRKDVYDDAIKAAASAYKYGIINGCNVSTITAIEELLQGDDHNGIDREILVLIQDGFIYTYKTVLNNWIPEEKVMLRNFTYEELEDGVGDFYEDVERVLMQYTKTPLFRLMGCEKSDSYNIFHNVVSHMIKRTRRRELMFSSYQSMQCDPYDPYTHFSLYDFLIEYSILNDTVFDVVNKCFSKSIVNSFQTDDEILTASVDLLSLMISGNQMIVTQRNSF